MKTSRWASVLLGSVITAAFIGPGTVTTCARAGVEHGQVLLWALLFATVACFLLQDAVARLTSSSGLSLGRALGTTLGEGAFGRATLLLVVGSVVFGCAAYQAGNLLGGTAGIELATGWPRMPLMVLSIVAAGALLASGRTRWVSAVLAALVALMGFAFLGVAILLRPDPAALVQGLLVPALPAGSLLLALGLVGTTVVPYNFFLGAGLAEGKENRDLRFGLAIAIGLGGLISAAIVVVGSAVPGPFSYEAVSGLLAARLGGWAGPLFGWGLFAAGFSSAITAPWAAALAVRSTFAQGPDDPKYAPGAWRFRATWLAVLGVGAAFGLSGVRPIPVILLAQAANGVILPLVAAGLWLSLANPAVMGERRDGRGAQVTVFLVVLVTVALGIKGLLGALATAAAWPSLEGPAYFLPLLAASVLLLLVLRFRRP